MIELLNQILMLYLRYMLHISSFYRYQREPGSLLLCRKNKLCALMYYTKPEEVSLSLSYCSFPKATRFVTEEGKPKS